MQKGVHESQDFNFFHPDSKLTDPTVFGIDFRKDYKLANDDWKVLQKHHFDRGTAAMPSLMKEKCLPLLYPF